MENLRPENILAVRQAEQQETNRSVSSLLATMGKGIEFLKRTNLLGKEKK
jgi:hypothetical protein